jgi:hypothetical protein
MFVYVYHHEEGKWLAQTKPLEVYYVVESLYVIIAAGS